MCEKHWTASKRDDSYVPCECETQILTFFHSSMQLISPTTNYYQKVAALCLRGIVWSSVTYCLHVPELQYVMILQRLLKMMWSSAHSLCILVKNVSVNHYIVNITYPRTYHTDKLDMILLQVPLWARVHSAKCQAAASPQETVRYKQVWPGLGQLQWQASQAPAAIATKATG